VKFAWQRIADGRGTTGWSYGERGLLAGHKKADARSLLGAGVSRRRPAPLPARLSARYCGCGSDSRFVSSWMSTATLASAWACTRPWCAQKRSSPELASSTRTYAWAPQRSQTSRAVRGLVGAMAPVNVASWRRASGFYVRLARVYALPLSATHTHAPAFPTPGAVRHKRNRIRTLSCLFLVLTRGARVPPGRDPAAHRHRVSLADIYPDSGRIKHFRGGSAAWHAPGTRRGTLLCSRGPSAGPFPGRRSARP
jgi:hypothetical protein